ncbi:hypothetical protein LO909_004440 [Aeromonas hydrophila]|nr:hypothetical protein [Aeromonas hydrophila]EIS3746625.1 hypothetical protein [Aeromonas hydrophila]
MSKASNNIDFIKEVDEISKKAIDAFGLSYDKTASENLHDPLLRWCDFILRYIPNAKRHVYKSDKFPAFIPKEAEKGLKRIEELFIAGGDVNPYQSKTLTRFNDTSSKKKNKRTDMLWADWGIHHLHLPHNAVAPAEQYSERSEWILFLKVYNDAVLFIDVKNHSKSIEPELFSQQELIKTFIRSWPQETGFYEMKGVVGLARNEPLTDADIGTLRRNGVNVPIEINGKVYAPLGMGVTTAVTSTRVSSYCNRIYHYARDLEKVVLDERNEFMKDLKELSIDRPNFKIMMFDDGGLGIYEEKLNKAWKFPRTHPQIPNDLYCLFNNLLIPEWAGPVVASYWKNNP